MTLLTLLSRPRNSHVFVQWTMRYLCPKTRKGFFDTSAIFRWHRVLLRTAIQGWQLSMESIHPQEVACIQSHPHPDWGFSALAITKYVRREVAFRVRCSYSSRIRTQDGSWCDLNGLGDKQRHITRRKLRLRHTLPIYTYNTRLSLENLERGKYAVAFFLRPNIHESSRPGWW